MKGFVLAIVLLFLQVSTANAQVVVGDQISFEIGSSTISTNGSIVHPGSWTWGAGSGLLLFEEGVIEATNTWQVGRMVLHGDFLLNGNIEVTEALILQAGRLNVPENSRLQVNRFAEVSTTGNSFVNGALFHQGTGLKFYPVGKNELYAPVTLLDVTGSDQTLVGLEAFDTTFEGPLTSGIASFGNAHWEVFASEDYQGSRVQLPVLNEASASYSIIEGDFADYKILGSQLREEEGVVTSLDVAFGPVLMIGVEIPGDDALVIHNIVSPDRKDGKNDTFYIENIERHNENVVILLDRNGTELCRMENFTNNPEGQTGCDLERLPAGHYICIVEYGGRTSAPTLITILK